MRSMGYAWDAKKRTWTRGNPSRTGRLECRSGGRVLRWVDGGADLDGGEEPILRQALVRFEAALRDAREEALGSEEAINRRVNFQLKGEIEKPRAPFVWLALQIAIACAIGSALPAQQQAQLLGGAGGNPFVASAIGASFGPLVASLRRERLRRLPGVEDADGALERLLVDAALGSYALPAPKEWRAEERWKWGVAAVAAESIAAANAVAALHAGVQASVADALSAPVVSDAFLSEGAAAEPTLVGVFIGVLSVALPIGARAWCAACISPPPHPACMPSVSIGVLSVALRIALGRSANCRARLVARTAPRTASKPRLHASHHHPTLHACHHHPTLHACTSSRWLAQPPLDGIGAELAASARLADSAEAYYAGMAAPNPTAARVSVRVTRALAAAWASKFGIASHEPQLYQGGLAFVSVAACALAYELSGRSVLAPWAALVVAAADLYVLRPDAEQSRVDASFAPSETSSG